MSADGGSSFCAASPASTEPSCEGGKAPGDASDHAKQLIAPVNTTSRRRPANKRGLGTLTIAFPCVICSFTIVVLVLCFCACPLIQYRLKGQVGYDYFAFLYFVFGFLVFGVVVESLLIAWRKNFFGSCCRRDEEQPKIVSESQHTFSNVAFNIDYGSLQEDPGLKAQLCSVHVQQKMQHSFDLPPEYDYCSGKNEKVPLPLDHQQERPRNDTTFQDAIAEVEEA